MQRPQRVGFLCPAGPLTSRAKDSLQSRGAGNRLTNTRADGGEMNAHRDGNRRDVEGGVSKQWPPVAAVTAGVFVWLVRLGHHRLAGASGLPASVWPLGECQHSRHRRHASERGCGIEPRRRTARSLSGGLHGLSMGQRQDGESWCVGAGLVVLLAVGNALATANFWWVHVVGLPLFLLCGSWQRIEAPGPSDNGGLTSVSGRRARRAAAGGRLIRRPWVA